MTARDGEGFRVGEVGQAVLLLVEYSTGELVAPTTTLELFKKYWEKIGRKGAAQAARAHPDDSAPAVGGPGPTTAAPGCAPTARSAWAARRWPISRVA